MNLGQPLGHAGDGMNTKLTNEMRHLRREAGVTVIKSIAPVIEGNPFCTARSSLSSDKKHVCQRPHVSHAEAADPESSQSDEALLHGGHIRRSEVAIISTTAV